MLGMIESVTYALRFEQGTLSDYLGAERDAEGAVSHVVLLLVIL